MSNFQIILESNHRLKIISLSLQCQRSTNLLWRQRQICNANIAKRSRICHSLRVPNTVTIDERHCYYLTHRRCAPFNLCQNCPASAPIGNHKSLRWFSADCQRLRCQLKRTIPEKSLLHLLIGTHK